ncbi:MAG: GntR family transcriptional regulator [Phycisphaerae bacterium]|nr:GntR family transcriptional regulator [Phycisphaerae bacterium]
MPISIEISPGSDTPIYSQIVDQVSQAIARGLLAPGERLPPVRRLAQDLVVNPNTVAKAFQILEQRGLVTTRIGSGTFVAEPGLRRADQTTIKAAAGQIDLLIGRCIHMGIDGPAIRRLVEDRLAQFRPGDVEGERHG